MHFFFYELFVKFWSQHNQVQVCQCQSNQCMLNFVFDTHMKAHRLVCAYTGSCDESIPELGAVAIGCPRMPLRSSSILLKNMTSKVFSDCVFCCFLIMLLHFQIPKEIDVDNIVNFIINMVWI